MEKYNLNLTQEELVMIHLIVKNQIDSVKPKLKKIHNLQQKQQIEDMIKICKEILIKTEESANANN